MKRSFFAIFMCLSACQSAGLPPQSQQMQPPAPTQNTARPAPPTNRQPDLSKLTPQNVTPYTYGSPDFQLEDILPLFSTASGYSQKWEFYIYTRPYEARLKFEISNLAFSKNEGKVRGHVKFHAKDGSVQTYKISKTFKNGQWKAEKSRLALQFGDYTLNFDGTSFHIAGAFEKGTFEYDVPLHAWKPGTGNVIFGNTPEGIFKYDVLTYHKPVSRGVFHVGPQNVDVSGSAYGNHYATTVPVYDMFDEAADFRKVTDDLLVEFRYYVPSSKYQAAPFGFIFMASNGVPVFESTDIERTPLATWTDDANYGYEIASRQRIDARDGSDSMRFEMTSATPIPSDPYADLPAFQRNVAMRFAKPIEYNIPIEYVIYLNAAGYEAKIPLNGSYSVTRLR